MLRLELAGQRTRGRPERFMNAVVIKKKKKGGEIRGESETVSSLIETAKRKRRTSVP